MPLEYSEGQPFEGVALTQKHTEPDPMFNRDNEVWWSTDITFTDLGKRLIEMVKDELTFVPVDLK